MLARILSGYSLRTTSFSVIYQFIEYQQSQGRAGSGCWEWIIDTDMHLVLPILTTWRKLPVEQTVARRAVA